MPGKHDPGLMDRIIAWLAGALAPRPEPVPVRVTSDREAAERARRGTTQPRRF